MNESGVVSDLAPTASRKCREIEGPNWQKIGQDSKDGPSGIPPRCIRQGPSNRKRPRCDKPNKGQEDSQRVGDIVDMMDGENYFGEGQVFSCTQTFFKKITSKNLSTQNLR